MTDPADILTLENEKIKVQLLPGFGGKIVSFVLKENDFELAAQNESGRTPDFRPGLPEKALHFGPYAFGMDDAFPNIDAEERTAEGRVLSYPDHGEVWQLPFEVLRSEEDAVLLRAESTRFEYTYEKELKLQGNTLNISFRITNHGADALPAFYTFHDLVTLTPDVQLFFPDGVKEFLNVYESTPLGVVGETYAAEDPRYDFQSLRSLKDGDMVKYYANGKVSEGRAGVCYPDAGVRYTIGWDPEKLPYLGVWITNGGMGYNLAVEPTGGFYDSIRTAEKNGALPALKSGETLRFDLDLTLEKDSASPYTIEIDCIGCEGPMYRVLL